MARNSEKAMTALARWRDLKLANEGAGGSGGTLSGVFLSYNNFQVKNLLALEGGLFWLKSALMLGHVNDGGAK